MTIAVTAVSGHLGSAIARKLSSGTTTEPVIGLARHPSNAKALELEIRPGDYNNPEQLQTSLRGIDTVLLVSGMAAPDDRIQQHRNVIDAAKANSVRKIVYTSIQGPEQGTGFSPVVQSNRQTEADIRNSGLDWAIGRNGIYIEPDVEYFETYKAQGEILNCAGEGKCGYTNRSELATAYARLLSQSDHDGQTHNFHGETMTQARLAEFLNQTFGTQLSYRPMSVPDYRDDRINELGEFIGSIIAGIYDGIRIGAFDNPSDFETVTGRQHQSWDAYFRSLRSQS